MRQDTRNTFSPLLFFKRISDVYDEQFSGFVSEGGLEYAGIQVEDLPIRIPPGAHWNDVREVTENVGQRLVEAFVAIEQANPAQEYDGRKVGGLEGIFGPKDGWTNKTKMPDSIITSLIEDFSKYTLSLKACPADEMGQAYEYLIGKFADDAGNTAQEFYTNRTVVQLMAEILQPRPDESIYDPTCGSGGMLVKCLDYLRGRGEEWRGVQVFGQEINGLTSSIARMNLYLNGVEDFSIVCGDTLEDPAFLDGSRLRKFNVVLANPPYSIKEWNRDKFMNDKWGRNFLGTPPQGRADYAFIQHIIASMDDRNGRCAILLPHGVLNRDEESEIRRQLVKTDYLETVIGMGRNLFYNSGLESCIVICNKNKQSFQRGNVLFIEAENYVQRHGKNAFLSNENINAILSAYYSSKNIAGLSCRVSTVEILKNGGNLNIKLYVRTAQKEKNDKNYSSEYSLAFHSNIEKLFELLSVENNKYEPKIINIPLTIDKTIWKRVKLGDVALEYSERVENPAASPYSDFVGSNCIGQYDFMIHNTLPTNEVHSAQKLFKAGDYLLVRRSLYGSDFRKRAPRANIDGVCSADILTIRENKEMVADGFLIYVLYSKELWDFIVSNSTGSLTRRIKWKQLAEYEFLLPPYKIQESISKKLWAAYRLKQGYKRLLTATDEMVKSAFIDMFGNPEENQRLGPAISIIRGVSYKPSDIREDSDEGAVAILRSNNICDGALNMDDMVYIDESRVSQNQRLKIRDIIICASNGSKNLVGKTGLNINFSSNCSFGTFCLLVRPDESIILSEFLNLFFQTPLYKEQISSLASGSNILNIKPEHINNLVLNIPPLSEQNKIVSIYRQAEKSKFELKRCIENIDKVIKSLING